MRDYTGLFNEWNRVSTTFTLLDHIGQPVWKQTDKLPTSEKRVFKIYEELQSGEYTLQIHVPTASGKSITFEKALMVIAEERPSIEITSPTKDFFTNEDHVNIVGSYTANRSIVLELEKDNRLIEEIRVETDEHGKFTHEYTSLADGTYQVHATNKNIGHVVSFTIDRAAPEKAKEIIFEEQDSNLQFSWGGAIDAASYTVEVAKNGSPFKILNEHQHETSAVISAINPNTVYKVRITSYDQAGNASLSDVATFKVGGKSSGGNNSSSGNRGNSGVVL